MRPTCLAAVLPIALFSIVSACGPLRLLVPTDEKGSRSIRGLVRVDLSESPR